MTGSNNRLSCFNQGIVGKMDHSGYPGSAGILDQHVMPRGYRVLEKIPRLPLSVIDNLVKEFGALGKTLVATIEELDGVEGIGEVRARSIKDGLNRYREKVLQEWPR